MNKERFIRISSWALILGAITLMLGDTAFFLGDPLNNLDWLSNEQRFRAFYLAPLGQLILAIGVLGLLYRYGDEVGRLGKVALAIGVIGGFVAASGLIDLVSEVWADQWIEWSDGSGGKIGLSGFLVLHLGGLWVLYLSLVVFGVTALIRKPLPRWNWLPILAGIVPLMVTVDALLVWPNRLFRLFPRLRGDPQVALGVSISAVALVMLGYVLQADTHRDSAIA